MRSVIGRLISGALAILILGSAPAAAADNFTVSDPAELETALRQAQGGESILLMDGNYGDVDFRNLSFTDHVTIASESGKAVFNSLGIKNSSYLRIDGVHVSSDNNGGPGSKVVEIVEGSHHIEILNSEVNGKVDDVYVGHLGIFTSDAENITIRNNNVHDVKNGIVTFGAKNLVVSGNKIDNIAEDAMKFSGVFDFLVEGNQSHGLVFPQPRSHLDFIQFQGVSGNGTIRGNILLVNKVAYIQGIFLDDAEYTNITIEDNVIYTGMANGIIISEGSGNTVRNNTLLNAPELVHPVTKIGVVDGTVVENNIISLRDGGMDGSNLAVQHRNPNGPYSYDRMFTNARAGLAVTPADLRPKPSSLAAKMGAFKTLSAD